MQFGMSEFTFVVVFVCHFGIWPRHLPSASVCCTADASDRYCKSQFHSAKEAWKETSATQHSRCAVQELPSASFGWLSSCFHSICTAFVSLWFCANSLREILFLLAVQIRNPHPESFECMQLHQYSSNKLNTHSCLSISCIENTMLVFLLYDSGWLMRSGFA